MRMRRIVLAVLGGLLATVPARAAVGVKVAIPGRGGVTLSGLAFYPEGEGPFPGIVALHGCGGLLTKSGRLLSRETDWADRLVAAGYAVVFPDSFNPRGYASVCDLRERPVLPERERVRDAYDTLAWFEKNPRVRPDAIALMGWSHGAMTGLWVMATDSPGRIAGLPHDFAGAVLFYPGCAQAARQRPTYGSIAPMLMQLGAEDQWTPAKSCVRLMEGMRQRGDKVSTYDLYPGAVHGFDQPKGEVHERRVRNSIYAGGEKVVRVGRDPAAGAQAIPRAMAWLGMVLREGR